MSDACRTTWRSVCGVSKPKKKTGHRKNVSDTVSAACPRSVGVGNVSNTWTRHSSEVSVLPSLEAVAKWNCIIIIIKYIVRQLLAKLTDWSLLIDYIFLDLYLG